MAGARRATPRWVKPLAIVGGIVLALLLLVYLPLKGGYNQLVERDQAVDTSFAQIDVQLQRRVDLIPNLANSVKAALGQEQAVFGEIARARTQYGGARSVDDKVAASNQLEGGLARLLVIVEQFPTLRSNDNIRDLMVQLEGTENRISQALRDYNEKVQDYNLAVRRFPGSLLAGLFGFEKREPFAATPGATTPPTVDLNPSPTPS